MHRLLKCPIYATVSIRLNPAASHWSLVSRQRNSVSLCQLEINFRQAVEGAKTAGHVSCLALSHILQRGLPGSPDGLQRLLASAEC